MNVPRTLAAALAVSAGACSLIVPGPDDFTYDLDAGRADGAVTDAGPPDADPNDGGPSDAAPDDSGADADPGDAGPPPRGTVAYAVRMGEGGDEIFAHAAASADGGVFIAARFFDSSNFGGATFTGEAAGNAAVVRLAPDGAHVWSTAIGQGGEFIVEGVTTDDSGDVTIVGVFTGTVRITDIIDLTSSGDRDGFVIRLNGVDGTVRWANSFGGALEVWPRDVASDRVGNIFVTGHYWGTAGFFGTNRTSRGASDAFVVSVDSDGVFRWVQSFGSTLIDRGYDVAVDPVGNVIVTGFVEGPVDFLLPAESHFAARDGVVAKLAGGTGAHLWSHLIGGAGLDIAYAATTLSDSTVIVAGEFELAADVGTDTHSSTGGADVFVATYSAAGVFQRSAAYGGPARDRCLAVERSLGDSYVLSGYIEDSANLGGTPTGFFGGQDAFIASYQSDGTFEWQHATGSSAGDTGDAVVLAGAHLWWVVSFGGLINIDGTELRSRGARDLGALALIP